MPAWSSGLFDCFNDVGICFYGWCCTPCLYGKNAEKIDGSSCCGQACAWCLLAPLGVCFLIHMGKRESLRQRYDLPQDWNDCVATTFFPTCALCQEARELKFRAAAPAAPTAVIVQPIGSNMYPPVRPAVYIAA